MLDDAKIISGLYPFFHLALLNDFASFGLWISIKLYESVHCSTVFPPSSVVGCNDGSRNDESFFCFFVFLQGRIFIKKIQQKNNIYIYNIVITVVLQMGHTLYIIKIIVSIMNH